MASFEDYTNFFTSVNHCIILDEDDKEAQLKSAYQPVLDKIKENIKKSTIIFLPNCELAVLQVFSSLTLLAQVS